MRYLIVAVLALPALAGAQGARMEDDGIPRVVASATKITRLPADRVTFYAVVESGAETAAEATQRAERKLQAVTEALRQAGARTEVTAGLPFGVSAAQNFSGFPGQTSQNPFVARYLVRVQPARIDQLMGISAAIIGAGATVTTPQFESSAADSVRRSKFAEAVTQARADAEALAAAAGMRLGSILEVSAMGSPIPSFGPQFMSVRGMVEMSGPSQPPDVVITTTVTVRYRLQPR